MVEYIDVINEDGSPAGYSLPRSEIHSKGMWHRVVHVWLVDTEGNLLIQQRSANKESFASYWDISCAGHIEAGMNSIDTAIKELDEELGLHITDASKLEYLFTYNELADVYLYTFSKHMELSEFKLQEEEVQALKWLHYTKLFEMVSRNDPTFVPLKREDQTYEFCDYKKFFETLEKKFPCAN
ncbi:hypothetical protein PPL_01099 [Heterostelium album PN500]|uniref:Nudix hydrolase domain-containing protein n=1 Tax=Heterostelium pallidum (strain ATCC 26659 / Pp 5 / PN500) TaxID=670386 RepID=D3AY40_HETP5|nr:hypothetical protein PPL_01099 [Heterostelium album PN500]EFA85867.1 hypothetical protein PPL_01099 [Heterostelium album PN500]|eukprot:XP_020437973.1 hypothetical protein PPL_01099 [Heterostelium album PN500]